MMPKSILRGLAAAAALLVVSGEALAQASPSAFTTGSRYDAEGRVTGMISPDPDGTGPLKHAAVRNTYDAAGRLIRVEAGELASWQSEAVAPSAWTGFTVLKTVDTNYDALDRKTVEKVGSGGTVHTVTQYGYDLAGRLECTTVRMNPAAFGSLPVSACTLGPIGSHGGDRITRNIYDAAGQLLQVREGVGTSIEAAEVTYSYTPTGKKRTVADGNGNLATFEYDPFDRLIAWRFPSASNGTVSAPCNIGTVSEVNGITGPAETRNAGDDCEKYAYDRNGNRMRLYKRDGRWIGYSYDALNRMVAKGSSYMADVAYTYDLRGLQLTAKFASSGEGITSTYNGFGELTSSTIAMAGFSKALSYAYDREGRRTTLTHPDGQKFTYVRDGLGRLANLYEGTSQTSTAQVLQATFNTRGMIGVLKRSSGTNGFTATYGYDPIGRLAKIVNDATGTANDLTIDGSVNNEMAYNPASQIINQRRSNDSYSWTGAVALTRAYTTNGLNQYTTAGPASFTYDANGNLTSDGSSTFVYDVENRLVSVSGASSASLTYDPMGRLWQVTGATTNTRFLYDGDELVAEYDSAGTLARRYVHSDNADDPVVQYAGAGVGAAYRTFLMPDERGSIAGLFTNAGASLAKNSYDEYGIPGAANQGRFQYTGQIWLPELGGGVYYYKARIYSAPLGRFLQVDPIGYDDQVNLYAYVGNDPVNSVDPTGNEAGCITLNTGCGMNGSEGREISAEDAGTVIGAVVGFVAAALDGPPGDEPAGAIGGARVGRNIGRAIDERVGPGPYAKESIPAQPGRPTAAQQREINRMGQEHGCHTCGTKQPGTKSGNFVGDHQPPKRLNPPSGKQEFYPHCQGCSNTQGGRVSQMPKAEAPPPPPLKPWWKW